MIIWQVLESSFDLCHMEANLSSLVRISCILSLRTLTTSIALAKPRPGDWSIYDTNCVSPSIASNVDNISMNLKSIWPLTPRASTALFEWDSFMTSSRTRMIVARRQKRHDKHSICKLSEYH